MNKRREGFGGLEKPAALWIWVRSFSPFRNHNRLGIIWLWFQGKSPLWGVPRWGAFTGQGSREPQSRFTLRGGNQHREDLLLGYPPDSAKADPLKKIRGLLRAQSPKAPSAMVGASTRVPTISGTAGLAARTPVVLGVGAALGGCREIFPTPPCPKKMSLILAPAERVH